MQKFEQKKQLIKQLKPSSREIQGITWLKLPLQDTGSWKLNYQFYHPPDCPYLRTAPLGP